MPLSIKTVSAKGPSDHLAVDSQFKASSSPVFPDRFPSTLKPAEPATFSAEPVKPQGCFEAFLENVKKLFEWLFCCLCFTTSPRSQNLPEVEEEGAPSFPPEPGFTGPAELAPPLLPLAEPAPAVVVEVPSKAPVSVLPELVLPVLPTTKPTPTPALIEQAPERLPPAKPQSAPVVAPEPIVVPVFLKRETTLRELEKAISGQQLDLWLQWEEDGANKVAGKVAYDRAELQWIIDNLKSKDLTQEALVKVWELAKKRAVASHLKERGITVPNHASSGFTEQTKEKAIEHSQLALEVICKNLARFRGYGNNPLDTNVQAFLKLEGALAGVKTAEEFAAAIGEAEQGVLRSLGYQGRFEELLKFAKELFFIGRTQPLDWLLCQSWKVTKKPDDLTSLSKYVYGDVPYTIQKDK